jgi:hypothetical protein
VEEVTYRSGVLSLGLVASLSAFSQVGLACPETFREFRLSDRIRLVTFEGLPVRHANIVVREAFGQTARRTRWGSPVGDIVRRGRTDRNGYFNLVGLRGQHYWLTYDDSKNGESFFLSREEEGEAMDREPLELKLNSFGGVCYLFDLEHNTTKPPGWHTPIESRSSRQ